MDSLHSKLSNLTVTTPNHGIGWSALQIIEPDGLLSKSSNHSDSDSDSDPDSDSDSDTRSDNSIDPTWNSMAEPLGIPEGPFAHMQC